MLSSYSVGGISKLFAEKRQNRNKNLNIMDTNVLDESRLQLKEANKSNPVTTDKSKTKRKKLKMETTETITSKTIKDCAEVILKKCRINSLDDDHHEKKKRARISKDVNQSEGEETGSSKHNSSSNSQTSKHADNSKDDLEKLSRTIFIGNLPSNFSKKQLKSLFSKYGKAQSVRIRNVIPGRPKLSKKVAVITKAFHPERSSINAYVVFSGQKMANDALELNGFTIEGNTIRVDIASNDNKHDCLRSVFVGNLPFGLQDDELRSFFKECGAIDSVRIIRDQKTGAGKGFGYVLFQSKTSIPLALKKHKEVLANRNIRVFRAKQVKEKHANRNNAENSVEKLGSIKKLQREKNHTETRSFEGERAVENVQERVKVQRNIKIAVKNFSNKHKLSN